MSHVGSAEDTRTKMTQLSHAPLHALSYTKYYPLADFHDFVVKFALFLLSVLSTFNK